MREADFLLFSLEGLEDCEILMPGTVVYGSISWVMFILQVVDGWHNDSVHMKVMSEAISRWASWRKFFF